MKQSRERKLSRLFFVYKFKNILPKGEIVILFLKKHWFWIVISSIIISWIGNTLYFESKQLDRPVFLTHYIDQDIEQEITYLSLYYITNKTDLTELQQIQLGDLILYPQQPNGFFFMHDQTQQQSYQQEFTHHYLKKATFEIHKDQFNSNHLKDGLTVEKVYAVFSQSSSMSYSIGQIRLSPQESRSEILRNDSSSGSSNGDFQSIHSASEALVLTELHSPFAKELETEYAIRLTHNNQSYFAGKFNNTSDKDISGGWPIQIGENERLLTNIQLNTKSNKVLNLRFNLIGQTSSGKNFQTSIYSYQDPYLTQADIHSYIERASEAK